MRVGIWLVYGTVIGALMLGAGCVTDRGGKKAPEKAEEPAKQEVKAPPSDSPLAKIEKGMGQKQVTDILGQPNDTGWYRTGKAWIPYYYGRDTARTIYYYKALGRVVFGGNERVVIVDYDPEEDGYK